MIAKLKGIVDTIGLDHILVDVNGVCYHVFASTKTLSGVGGEGQPVVLLTEMVIRNELPQLFGFHDLSEQEWFRLLTTVQGVGARVALAILSVLTPDELTLSIYNQDKSQITRADGVGPKLALRIISELKDKVSGLSALPTTKGSISHSVVGKDSSAGQVADAFSALESLGYRRHEVAGVIQQAIQQLGTEASTGDVVRTALSIFGNRLAG